MSLSQVGFVPIPPGAMRGLDHADTDRAAPGPLALCTADGGLPALLDRDSGELLASLPRG
jgi:hypothetical protein